ncbi:hypothetical protein D3C86_2204030 [compost metagenome]
MIEEKRRHMVIENVEQHIRLSLCEPRLDGLEAPENRRPGRFTLFVVVDSETDSGRM